MKTIKLMIMILLVWISILVNAANHPADIHEPMNNNVMVQTQEGIVLDRQALASTKSNQGLGKHFGRIGNHQLSPNHPDRFIPERGIKSFGLNMKGSGTGSISGRVTDAVTGVGLYGIVYVYDESHNYVTGLYTDQNGYYQTSTSLGAGSYNMFTWNFPGYINELYGGTQCYFTCYNQTSQLVSVGSGDTPNIDFSLDEGTSISGVVTDNTTSNPISYAGDVYIHDNNGMYLTHTGVDANGHYLTTALEPGSYYAYTYNYSGYIDELYDDIVCNNCNVTSGTAINISTTSATNIDFALDPGAVFSGHITDMVTGNDLQYYRVQVFNSAGQIVTRGSTDGNGYYQTDAGVPPGSYYVRTYKNQTTYIDEVYDNIPCMGNCDVTAGHEFVVTDANPITGVDFALDKAINISGKVTDVATGLGIQSIQISFYDSTFNYAGYAFTNSNGDYTSPAVEAGSYYIRTYNSQGFINEVYNDIQCGDMPCSLSNGDPVVVGNQSVTGIDIALDKGAVIRGTVTDHHTGLAITSGYNSMRLYNSSGVLLESYGFGSVPGTYYFPGKVDGTYYIKASNYSGYISEIYDDIPCPVSCDVTTGDPIVISNTNDVENIDFALQKEDLIFESGFE